MSLYALSYWREPLPYCKGWNILVLRHIHIMCQKKGSFLLLQSQEASEVEIPQDTQLGELITEVAWQTEALRDNLRDNFNIKQDWNLKNALTKICRMWHLFPTL